MSEEWNGMICICGKKIIRKVWKARNGSGKVRLENKASFMRRESCCYSCSHNTRRWRTVEKLGTKICEWCGGEYNAKRCPGGQLNSVNFSRQRYCSRSCTAKANYMTVLFPHSYASKSGLCDIDVYTCHGCARSFERMNHPSVGRCYCSRACYIKNYLKKRVNRNRTMETRSRRAKESTQNYVARIDIETLQDKVRCRLSEKIPAELRDDICQEIYVDIFAGNIPVKGMDEYIAKRVSRINRLVANKFSGLMSLEQEMKTSEGDGVRLVDLL